LVVAFALAPRLALADVTPPASTAAASTSTAPPSPAPAPAAATAPPPAVVPASPPGEPGGGTGTPAAPVQEETPKRRYLVPVYPEELYPGMPDEDGYMPGIPLDSKGLRFAMHGYFRAPMRITPAERPIGEVGHGEGSTDWRSPYLVDDDYYHS